MKEERPDIIMEAGDSQVGKLSRGICGSMQSVLPTNEFSTDKRWIKSHHNFFLTHNLLLFSSPFHYGVLLFLEYYDEGEYKEILINERKFWDGSET